jgi:NADH-dependent peroxiredoxin subunit C
MAARLQTGDTGAVRVDRTQPAVEQSIIRNNLKTRLMNMTECKVVSVGMDVPNFEMETYDPAEREFGKISLEQLKKKDKWTILVFYPADFTFVCPTELADLAEKSEALKKLGAEVISVSTDTKFSHLAWKDAEKLLAKVKYPMGADPTGTVSRLFGVYDCGTGLALRGTFVINPQGKLVSAEVNFYNVGRNADELLRKMEANAYLMKHPDEACPAKWHQGAKTLKPSEKMVGKVYEALHG